MFLVLGKKLKDDSYHKGGRRARGKREGGREGRGRGGGQEEREISYQITFRREETIQKENKSQLNNSRGHLFQEK